jgi:hypothetical protein
MSKTPHLSEKFRISWYLQCAWKDFNSIVMDPLSALGLAANILQFVDFTSKLFSAGYNLHKAGSTHLELDLGQVVDDLGDVARHLTSSLCPPGMQGALNSDDQASTSLLLLYMLYLISGLRRYRAWL